MEVREKKRGKTEKSWRIADTRAVVFSVLKYSRRLHGRPPTLLFTTCFQIVHNNPYIWMLFRRDVWLNIHVFNTFTVFPISHISFSIQLRYIEETVRQQRWKSSLTRAMIKPDHWHVLLNAAVDYGSILLLLSASYSVSFPLFPLVSRPIVWISFLSQSEFSTVTINVVIDSSNHCYYQNYLGVLFTENNKLLRLLIFHRYLQNKILHFYGLA